MPSDRKQLTLKQALGLIKLVCQPVSLGLFSRPAVG